MGTPEGQEVPAYN